MTAASETASPDAPAAPFDLEPGSTLAQALYEIASGRTITIIDSPPGAGKTTLATRLAYYLHVVLPNLPVTITTPTNHSGQALIAKLAGAYGPDCVVAGSSNIMPEEWAGEVMRGDAYSGAIAVQTVASAAMKKDAAGGLYIVDEAYQTAFSEVISAVETADQLLFIGDPGQIGPVVTVNTAMFDRSSHPPHVPAPVVFARNPGAAELTLDSTYRLGETTTDIVAEFYDFDFASRRLPQTIESRAEIETTVLERFNSPHHPDMLDILCDEVIDLLGTAYTAVDEDGTEVTRELTGHDIAVVVAHNSQRAYIDARLTGLLTPADHLGLTVGTADSLQGGQWPAVVALDPLAGVQAVTDHHAALGRLCVMLSRHQAHLSYFTDEKWKESVAEADDMTTAQRQIHRRVRSKLIKA